MKHIFTLFFALLSIFSEAQDTLFQQTIPITPHPFSATKIRNDLHIDASGNYWLAFEKSGLGKFNGSSWSFFDTIGNVLPVLKVNHVTTDIAGNIFAGTSAGLSVFNGTNWQHFNNSNSSLPASGVTTVETNGIDTWIGTNTGIYKYTNGSFTIPPVDTSLMHDEIAAKLNAEVDPKRVSAIDFIGNDSVHTLVITLANGTTFTKSFFDRGGGRCNLLLHVGCL